MAAGFRKVQTGMSPEEVLSKEQAELDTQKACSVEGINSDPVPAGDEA